MGHRWKLRAAGLAAGLGLAALTATVQAAGTDAWDTVKSQHFLVLNVGDEAFASRVSEAAEGYYQSIAEDLGYSRKTGFWLWENRVRILIYPTVEAFRVANNAPAWAAGRASGKLHEIAGCRTSGDAFISTVLPHEMAHLVLGEFVGNDRLPQWVNEGFAQWEQGSRKASPPTGGATAQWFTLAQLTAMDVRQETDPARVQRFYMQSVSLVGFLISTYGGDRFGRFCRELRDGRPLSNALQFAYPDFTSGLTSLEQAWRQYAGLPGG